MQDSDVGTEPSVVQGARMLYVTLLCSQHFTDIDFTATERIHLDGMTVWCVCMCVRAGGWHGAALSLTYIQIYKQHCTTEFNDAE
jgi:hypothetical protein